MAETIGTAYVQVEPSFEGVTPKIEKEFGGAGDAGGKSFGAGFGSVVGVVGKAAGAALAAGTAAVAGITKEAVSAYSDFEQLEGGIETLFGDSASKVISDSKAAFESAGMSANQYMETTIESAAAMINSLGGDQAQAADMVNMSITDMADNVNKMGTDMEAVQNAYRGFSRGNFTMLDNLALGFAGTKEGMQELLDKAQELSGVEYDIDSYADIVKAIHEVQDSMGITGTTMKEASDTISGSLATMKAAWQNTLSAMGQGDMSLLSDSIDSLISSAETFGENILPIIENALLGVSQLIAELAPKIAETLPDLLASALPKLSEAATSIIESLAMGLLENLPVITKCVMDIIVELIKFVISNISLIIRTLVDLAIQVVNAIVDALPEIIEALIEALPDIIDAICDGLIEAIPALINAAIQLCVILVEHLPEIIAGLIEAIPDIIAAIIQGFAPLGGQLLDVFGQAFSKIGEVAKKAFDAVVKFFKELPGNLARIAGEAVGSFINMLSQLPGKVKALFDKVLKTILSFATLFVQKGPSMAKEFISGLMNNLMSLPGKMFDFGKKIIQKLLEGIKESWKHLKETVEDLVGNFMEGLMSKLDVSSKIKETKKAVRDATKDEDELEPEANGSAPARLGSMAPQLLGSAAPMLAAAEAVTAVGASSASYDDVAMQSPALNLLAEYLPMIAEGLSKPIEVNQNDRGIFTAVRSENRKLMTATGYHALA
jgi:hypothetical protein